jgi:WD40 repeat protein
MTLIASAELYDPATGKFSATGSMATSRDFTTATLLADGRVLIAGGFDGSKSLASAELYDPTTGKFSPTGSMAVARFAHTSTLLPDGRVLIAGGDDKSDLASAEIYDPKTGKFSPTGSMSQARYSHTATLLQNGVVLIAGGDDDSGASLVTLASAELYDPATGKFNPTGSMQTAREYHTATLLSDGRALITGGYVVHPGSDDATLASAELYDPATGKFSATASIKNERRQHTATLLSDGRALITGGYVVHPGSDDATLASAELYDPATGKFSATASMKNERRQHTATLLSDGRVLIAGGEDESETALASTELYDPEAGKFSPAGSLAQARFYHTATRLSDGRVLIAGGDDESGLASAELYQP